VLDFDNELKMLMVWRAFVEEVDMDLIIGYNISNFNLPYLLDRAKALRGIAFPYFGRLKGGGHRSPSFPAGVDMIHGRGEDAGEGHPFLIQGVWTAGLKGNHPRWPPATRFATVHATRA
jgi:hypothetical protein